MENQRKNGKGSSKGGYEHGTNSVEENKNQLEHLERTGGYRCLCSLEHRCSGSVTTNRFAALQELDEDEQMANDPVNPPGLTLGDFIHVKPRFHKKIKAKKTNQWAHVNDLNNLEINTMHEKGDPNELTITIGSGASENECHLGRVRPSGESEGIAGQ